MKFRGDAKFLLKCERQYGEQLEKLPNFSFILSGKLPNVADFCPTKGAAAPTTPSPLIVGANSSLSFLLILKLKANTQHHF